MRFSFHSTAAIKINHWLAAWVMLAVLFQAIVPAIAVERSNSSPELWNEICSVAGVRPGSVTGKDGSAAMHHADCPLCLQLSPCALFSNSQASIVTRLFLFGHISFAVTDSLQTKIPATLPEARAPPEFN